MEIINVPDISVIHGGLLHSLRGQKIVQNAATYGLNSVSGIVKSDKLYVLDGDYAVGLITKSIDVEIVITSDSAITVDFGDGALERHDTPNRITHIYSDNVATHTIAIECDDKRAITYFYCNNMYLLQLDVRNCIALGSLDCSNCQLKNLDLSCNANIKKIHCDNNLLSTLDVRNNVKLQLLHCEFNPQLSSLHTSQNTDLSDLDVTGNNLNLIELANSLPDRTNKEAGQLQARNVSVTEIIPICTAKNWQIINQQ